MKITFSGHFTYTCNRMLSKKIMKRLTAKKSRRQVQL